jgi:hypothetical protein
MGPFGAHAPIKTNNKRDGKMNNLTADKVLKKTFEYLDQVLDEKKREEEQSLEQQQKKTNSSANHKKRKRKAPVTEDNSGSGQRR